MKKFDTDTTPPRSMMACSRQALAVALGAVFLLVDMPAKVCGFVFTVSSDSQNQTMDLATGRVRHLYDLGDYNSVSRCRVLASCHCNSMRCS